MRCRRIAAMASPAAGGRQLDAVVRLVVDEAAVGQALHGAVTVPGARPSRSARIPVWAPPSLDSR